MGGAGGGDDGTDDVGSYADMLQTLLAALEQDGSGMLFNEQARSLRSSGVFTEQFSDYVMQLAESAHSEDERCGGTFHAVCVTLWPLHIIQASLLVFDVHSDAASGCECHMYRLVLQRTVARLFNPLLRQAAPYE